MASNGPLKTAAKPPKCPVCKRLTAEAYRPFCSKRCADVDLGRWLMGTYAIAGGNSDADEDGDAITAPVAPNQSDSD